MKSHQELEKTFMDLAANNKISEGIKEQLQGKQIAAERYEKEQLYGYKRADGNQLVVDELPAENVKFIFHKIEEYIKTPPAELVKRTMSEQKRKGLKLTYEDAIPLVSFYAIQEYVAEEVTIKNMAFALSDLPHSVETLRAILERPFSDFPVVDIRIAYQDKIQTADSDTFSTWGRRVRRMSRSPFYTGTMTFTRSTSPFIQRQLAPKQYEIHCSHEAIISKEQFETVNKALKEARYRNQQSLEI